jgi:hypothetical protein
LLFDDCIFYAVTSWVIHQILADAVVMMHFGFVVFVVFGGIFVIFQPKAMWLHIPCVVWGAIIELTGYICPLTPLENYLRMHAGQSPYTGDFVIHYLEPVIYPNGLTRELQIIMGFFVIFINAVMYGWLFLKISRNDKPQ